MGFLLKISQNIDQTDKIYERNAVYDTISDRGVYAGNCLWRTCLRTVDSRFLQEAKERRALRAERHKMLFGDLTALKS